MKKIEGDETTLYINQYYEKRVSTGVVTETSSYYLRDKLIAQMEDDGTDTTLRYVHQDSLNSTSVMSKSDGTMDSSMVFYPFGATRGGDVNTDKKFTGKRLDGTGLYYYEARYYNPVIGRFMSPDTVSPDLNNPQSLNKYSYCFNNPLKYTDPTGHWPNWAKIGKAICKAATATVNFVKENAVVISTALAVVGMIPVLGEIADIADGVLSLCTGDIAGAALSFASAVPVIGNATGAAKLAKNAARLIDKADDIGDTLKTADRLKDAKKAIVIGENQDRVIRAAKDLGAEVFEGTGDAANRAWIQAKKAGGYKIYDIGPDFTRRAQRAEKGLSPFGYFYQLERKELKNYPLTKMWQRTAKTSGRCPW